MAQSGNGMHAVTVASTGNGNGYANGSTYYWDSQVAVFQSPDPMKLAEMLNEFYRGRFNIGTQTHYISDKKLFVAFAYYKVKA